EVQDFLHRVARSAANVNFSCSIRSSRSPYSLFTSHPLKRPSREADSVRCHQAGIHEEQRAPYRDYAWATPSSLALTCTPGQQDLLGIGGKPCERNGYDRLGSRLHARGVLA